MKICSVLKLHVPYKNDKKENKNAKIKLLFHQALRKHSLN